MVDYPEINSIPITSRYNWLVSLATQLSTSTEYRTGRIFVVAFAIKGGRILSIGVNSYKKSHPRNHYGVYKAFHSSRDGEYYAALHAEIKCLQGLGHFRTDYNKIEIFVARFMRRNKNEVAQALPCPNCRRVLSEYGFKRISFTMNDANKIGRVKL